MDADKKPVLKKVVLRTGGTTDTPVGIPVRPDPSPTKRPKILPVEMVEKNPKLVDIVTAEILDTARR